MSSTPDSSVPWPAIMMVTAETDMSQMQRALEAGANEYVMKTFTKDVLREKLQLVGLAAG